MIINIFISFVLLLPVIADVIILLGYPNYLAQFIPVAGVWQLLVLLLIAPIIEETTFRGLLQDIGLKYLKNKYLVILIVNLLFMLLHYKVNPDTFYLTLIFGCGVIFSVLKLVLGKLRYPILCHIYYNANFLFLLWNYHRMI